MQLQFLLPALYLPLLARAFSTPQPPFSPRAYTPLDNPLSCAAASWPPVPSNYTLLSPTQPSSELASILSQVDPARINATITKLVSFQTRHTLSTQNSTTIGVGAARDWIASEFRRYAAASDGRMTVTVPGYIQQPDGSRIDRAVLISDVVATLKGSEDPDRIHVVSGHYDSRVSDVMQSDGFQPGADDEHLHSASGVAISLELARMMAPLKPRATLVFVAVAGEEQGLYGSTFLAQTYKNASANVAAMFTNDIPGDPHIIRLFAQGPPLTESATEAATRLSIGGESDSPARELGRYAADVGSNDVTDMRVALEYRLDRYLRGGDHSPFLQAGYAACRFTEPAEDFAHQHRHVRVENGVQYGDLIQFVDMEYVARVAKVNGAVLWGLANAPGAPRNVRINATMLSNDSTFYWDGNEGEEVAGWEVVWRPTAAPQWVYAASVSGGGQARSATVDVSKDNVVFGIRAVGSNGGGEYGGIPVPVVGRGEMGYVEYVTGHSRAMPL